MKTILVAEDEAGINEMICDYLDALGFKTISATDGIEALKIYRKEKLDLVLLDIMMPRLDGTEVLREIRKESEIPILMVTARSGEGDTVLGLELGADDYIAKPFSMKELAARIRTVLRRSTPLSAPAPEEDNPGLVQAELHMDRIKRTVSIRGKSVELTAAQFNILEKLMKSPGRVFSRMDLLQAFQEDPYEGYERSIDVHIKNIRKLLEEDPGHPEYILTVWGVGYKMQDSQ
ncbi:response regulator transcription factor [Oceanispirochaeta sp.]|jgi:two-component system OmpR family response regulator|uniref:response regulator transcription factor n=1 Tax=Oceanispirochaeta sp. TaxID=2035350 RepID=UPI0026125861|nr:response regulator transcription factor [Oceanispirochaeta sp.]MDA3958331.1 response regulator transcription factor [Oceanispirochaeta sp.]